MPRHGHQASTGKQRIWTVVLSGLAALAIGLGVAGNAFAFDPPNLLEKAKEAAKNARKPAPKNAIKDAPKNTIGNTVNGGARDRIKNLVNGPAGGATRDAVKPTAIDANRGGFRNNFRNARNPQDTVKDRVGNAPNNAARNASGSAALRDRLNRGGPNANRLGTNPNRLGANPNPSAGNRSAALLRSGARRDLSRMAPRDYQRLRLDHRRSIIAARARLPHRLLPFERGFTGVPPVSETRFVSSEMVFQAGPNVSRQTLDAVARRLGLSTISSQTSSLTGGTLLHFRVADGRRIPDVIRALEAENLGAAQPNYVFSAVGQEANPAAGNGTPEQYVVSKLKLADVHRVATGSNVLIAVIDSAIDLNHPDLAGAVVDQFDAVGRAGKPDMHGTGMAGAIAARSQLMGIAPEAKILAIRAFSADGKDSPQATTAHILAGLDWAIKKGARVINMSFAGPADPMLQLALKKAYEKGVVLVAAAGNAGPKSPPLYPAADPHVIAVTATDENDDLFAGANQGPYVAVAAPGVNILEPAPDAAYQVTTGTSVAAAHVSGIAALLIERNPALDPAAVLEVLTLSASKADGRDDKLGWGLVDPAQALLDLDAKAAQDRAAAPTAAAKPAPSGNASPKPGPISSR
jgi:subtilisin family serine protease